ncbi:MAG: hypothetical protein NC933_05020, partial [Candidatus Omnitrophica bacterium]|nr:hypothetical protein [Candidatus Omnitrophota bacterium]
MIKRYRNLIIVWLSIISVSALFGLAPLFADEDPYYLQKEIEETHRHLDPLLREEANLRLFMDEYPTARDTLANIMTELDRFEERLSTFFRNNILKDVMKASLDTFSLISAGYGALQKSVGVLIASALTETGQQAGEYFMSASYNQAMRGISEQSRQLYPVLENVQNTLRMTIEEVQAVAREEEGEELTERAAVYRKYHMLFEEIRNARNVLNGFMTQLDNTHRAARERLNEIMPQIERLNARLAELEGRYKKAKEKSLEKIQSETTRLQVKTARPASAPSPNITSPGADGYYRQFFLPIMQRENFDSWVKDGEQYKKDIEKLLKEGKFKEGWELRNRWREQDNLVEEYYKKIYSKLSEIVHEQNIVFAARKRAAKDKEDYKEASRISREEDAFNEASRQAFDEILRIKKESHEYVNRIWEAMGEIASAYEAVRALRKAELTKYRGLVEKIKQHLPIDMINTGRTVDMSTGVFATSQYNMYKELRRLDEILSMIEKNKYTHLVVFEKPRNQVELISEINTLAQKIRADGIDPVDAGIIIAEVQKFFSTWQSYADMWQKADKPSDQDFVNINTMLKESNGPLDLNAIYTEKKSIDSA